MIVAALSLVVTVSLIAFLLIAMFVLIMGTPGSWVTTDRKYKALLGGLWLAWFGLVLYTLYRICEHIVDFLLWVF